jgi:hypothetical protein
MKHFAMAILAFAFYSAASQAAVTSLTVTSATLSNSTGAITVTGTIVCTTGDLFVVETNIIQVSGGRSGFTTGLLIMDICSGSVDTWVAPQTVKFGSIKDDSAGVATEAIDITDGAIAEKASYQPVTSVP